MTYKEICRTKNL